MPDGGERPAEENERRLETASFRDPPPNNYGIELLERQSGGRKKTGGIAYRENYKGWIAEIRIPKWKDSDRLWINSGDLHAAQYNADAALYYTGRSPVHFPNVKFEYLPPRLSTGEELTTRKKCSAYVVKIAKGSALRGQRKEFKDRVQKCILEMVHSPKVVQFLNIVRASPREPCQPRPQANPEDADSQSIDDENGTDMDAGTPIEEAIQSLPSTVVIVNSSQYGSLVPVEHGTPAARADDSEEENRTPMEVDSLSEEAIQTLAPPVTVDPAAVFQVDSTMTSFMDVDLWTSFIPSFEMDPYEPQGSLTSVGQSLGIRHPRFGEKEKGDLVPENCKELLASLDEDEEAAYKSTEPSDWDLWGPHPPFVPNSPLWATPLPGSGSGQSRGTTSGADAREAVRPPVRPILRQTRWRP